LYLQNVLYFVYTKMVILIPYLDVYNTHSSHGPFNTGGRRGRDRMVVGFTTTYAISAYHH